jgi:hypothetical protein
MNRIDEINWNDFQWYKSSMNWLEQLIFYTRKLEKENQALRLTINYMYDNDIKRGKTNENN